MYVRLVFWDSSLQKTVVFIPDNIPFQSGLKSLFQNKAKCSGGSKGGAWALIFRPNWGPKKFFLRPSPLLPSYLKVWIRNWSVTLVIWKWYFVLMQVKLIFTRKVSHLVWFWKWEFLELGSGLLLHWRRPMFTPALSPFTIDHFSGQKWDNLSLNVFVHSLYALVAFCTHFHCRRFPFHVLSVSSAKASGNCHVLAFCSCFHHPSTLVSTVIPERGCVCYPYFLWKGAGMVCREPSLGTVMFCFFCLSQLIRLPSFVQ